MQETAGETLWSGGERAHVYYTQHCGGMSEPASAVWPAEHAAYLAGQRADPYCLRRSPAEWHAQIVLTGLSEIFRAQGWQTPSPIAAIHVIRRGATGRAELLAVTGVGAPARLSDSSFRFAVNRALGWNQIRSDWYTARVSGQALELSGKGYGHGVGLCQAGAYEMAAEGKSAAQILNFYFPGTAIGITSADHGWQQVAGAGGLCSPQTRLENYWPKAMPPGRERSHCRARLPVRRSCGPGAANHPTVSANHGGAGLDVGLDPAAPCFCSPPPCGKTTEEPKPCFCMSFWMCWWSRRQEKRPVMVTRRLG